MIKKVNNYINDVISIIDNNLQCKSNNYQEKINNYNSYCRRLKENYFKRLKTIEKELPLLREKYFEALLGRTSQGRDYKGEYPRDIKKKIQNYEKALSPESKKVLIGSMEATGEFIKYLYYQEELNFDFSIFQGRPCLKSEWGQAYCTDESCLKRVKLILRDFTDPHTKVLFLGDDDLTSLVQGSLSSFYICVIDIDRELLEFIEEKNSGIHTRWVDLNKKIPSDLLNCFDAVCLNPYLNPDGIKMFLHAARDCLKKHRDSRIYMTSWPVAISEREYSDLQKSILDMGLIFREIITFFDWYDMTEWYSTMNNPTLISDMIGGEADPLLEKFSDLPAITPTMFILSPVSED
ncbi:MAG: hypothetical protein BWY64_04016 [bacterium ADurb.Bin363]|nr:MAG: hypothetical protein BWY64_04016 [bacterium ADurb.Bin363]